MQERDECGAWTRPIRSGATRQCRPARRAPDEVLEEIARICAMRDASRSPTLVEAGTSTAYGCTLQGQVEPSEVERLAQGVLDASADRVSLGDTVGYADPGMIERLFEGVMRAVGERLDSAHFHHVGGFGLTSAATALGLGIRRFDAFIGGIGGYPHSLCASGNVATEDLVYMLESMGFDTGQDIEALLRLREEVATWLRGEPMHGALWRAGLPRTMRDTRAAALAG